MKALLVVMLLSLTACGPANVVENYIQGTPGATGPTGEPGIAGATGPTGEPGQAGQPGKDATPVTVVPLCPGTTTYPSKFIEVAFCIGGHLYAVYSANNGFETELQPGTYQSAAIGSQCTFRVDAGCQVTQL